MYISFVGVCAWGGCRGTELSLGAWKTMALDIAESCTEILLEVRGQLSDVALAQLTTDAESLGGGISAEVGMKFGQMWGNLPYSILGFYGEAQGFSSADVNAHISSVFAEFDAIPDKACVHKVALGYLAEGTSTRQSLLLKVSLGAQLARFPKTFVKVRGHAISLLVSRRNEGDHRSMNMLAIDTPNVSGQLLMARLRRPQLDRLLTHNTFVTFLSKHWNGRGNSSIVARLLEHRLSQWKHNELSFYEKARLIYACDRSEMFVDTTPTQLALANAIASQPRVTREPITPVEEALVQLWYAVFKTGCIFGMAARCCKLFPYRARQLLLRKSSRPL